MFSLSRSFLLLTSAWSVFEFLFYIYFRLRLRSIQHFSPPPPLLPQDTSRSLIRKAWCTFSVHTPGDALGVKDFLSGWFFGAQFEKLRRGNVEEFLAWCLFSRFPNNLSESERSEVGFLLDLMRERAKIEIPEGYNKEVECMRLSLDPCYAVHRPLFVYVFFYLLTGLADFYLIALGFRLYSIGNLRYWYRPPQNQSTKEEVHKHWNGADSFDEPVHETWGDFYNSEFRSKHHSYPAPASNPNLPPHHFVWPHSSISSLSDGVCEALESKDEFLSFGEQKSIPRRFSAAQLASQFAPATVSLPSQNLNSSATLYDSLGDNQTEGASFPFNAADEQKANFFKEHENEETTDAAHRPIVFYHGVGVGLIGYAPMIFTLEAATRNRPFFLVELPYVSMRLWETLPTPFETAELTCVMLNRHGFSKACFVGHSFGSISVTWVIKMQPHIVRSAVLLDPVALLLCFPKVAYNFVYKPLDLWNPMAWILQFCSTELGMARVFYRHFWWYLNTLWVDELPPHCTVVLSAEDALVPSGRIKRHLEMYSPHTRVMWMPGFNHAQFLLYPNVIRRICDVIAASE